MRLAYSGGIAAEKLLSYIESLRSVDQRRAELGRRIHELLEEAEQIQGERPREAVSQRVVASQLAGQQEVMFHFFAVCVGRMERFLTIAAKAAGCKISRADRELLASFRRLRDYYEHMEDRLPAGTSYDACESEEERDGRWFIKFGFAVDEAQRIVVNGVEVDVTVRGLAAIEELLQRNWDALTRSSSDMVRAHFEQNPHEIVSPQKVNQELFVSVGGSGG